MILLTQWCVTAQRGSGADSGSNTYVLTERARGGERVENPMAIYGWLGSGERGQCNGPIVAGAQDLYGSGKDTIRSGHRGSDDGGEEEHR